MNEDTSREMSDGLRAENRFATVFLTLEGETLCCNDWDAKLGLTIGTVSKRLRRGWTAREALLYPLFTRRRLRLSAA